MNSLRAMVFDMDGTLMEWKDRTQGFEQVALAQFASVHQTLVALGKLEGYNMARRLNASMLNELLEDVVGVPTEASWAEHVYHQYTVRAERRDGLWDHLKREGVGAGVYYPHPLTEIPVLEGRAEVPAKVPVSERLAGEVISLPVHPGLTSQDIETVAMAVRGFYG